MADTIDTTTERKAATFSLEVQYQEALTELMHQMRCDSKTQVLRVLIDRALAGKGLQTVYDAMREEPGHEKPA